MGVGSIHLLAFAFIFQVAVWVWMALTFLLRVFSMVSVRLFLSRRCFRIKMNLCCGSRPFTLSVSVELVFLHCGCVGGRKVGILSLCFSLFYFSFGKATESKRFVSRYRLSEGSGGSWCDRRDDLLRN